MANATHTRDSGPTVLIVGVDAAEVRFCATFLEALGATVTIADDFRDAARALVARRPRLVILDPRTSGFDPRAWSRLMDDRARRPKILMVGDSDHPKTPPRPDLIADGYLQRPIRALDLVRVVELAAR